MLRSRIIPSLLLRDGGLVKTVNFSNARYVGDPINAVKIFNEKEVDELVLYDIGAVASRGGPDFELLEKIASQASMPLRYGGGVRSVHDATKLVSIGYEKILVSSAALENFDLVRDITFAIGAQSTVVTVDVRASIFSSRYSIFTENGTKKQPIDLLEFLKVIEDCGVGELVINSIDRDGKMIGYDIKLARIVRDLVSLPISFLGGCGSSFDMKKLIQEVGIVGACAGSMFVYNGPYKAVLISYCRP